MRAFRISLAMLALMGVLIGASTVYNRRACDELLRAVYSLPERPTAQAGDEVASIARQFERHKRLLLPTVRRPLVQAVSEALEELRSHSELLPQSTVAYRATRRRLLGAIEEMARAERGSFGLWG